MTTYSIKSGRCGITGCKETHAVVRVPSLWLAGLTGKPCADEYTGEHHGETFRYMSYMVTANDDTNPYGVTFGKTLCLDCGSVEYPAHDCDGGDWLSAHVNICGNQYASIVTRTCVDVCCDGSCDACTCTVGNCDCEDCPRDC